MLIGLSAIVLTISLLANRYVRAADVVHFSRGVLVDLSER